ncbi:hypothetical protein ACFL20_08075 [Spirochaetota bacterium]
MKTTTNRENKKFLFEFNSADDSKNVTVNSALSDDIIEKLNADAVKYIFVVTSNIDETDSESYKLLLSNYENEGFKVENIIFDLNDIHNFIDKLNQVKDIITKINSSFIKNNCLILSYGKSFAGVLIACLFIHNGKDPVDAIKSVKKINDKFITGDYEESFIYDFNKFNNMLKGNVDGTLDELRDDEKSGATFVGKTNINVLTNIITESDKLLKTGVVGNGHGQYPAASWSSFQSSIENAYSVKFNIKSSAKDIDAAITALAAAKSAFESNIIKVNFEELSREIMTSSETLKRAIVGNGNGQYPASEWTAYNSAIEAAIEIATSKSSSQSTVNATAAALFSAGKKFKSSIIDVDFSSISNAVSDAMDFFETCEVGFGNGQYLATDIDEFEKVLNYCNEILQKDNSSKSAVNDAVTKLRSSLTKIKSSVITVDFSVLSMEAASAQAEYETTESGNGNGQFPPSCRAAYKEAIDNANKVLKLKKASQPDVDRELAILTASRSQYQSNRVRVDFSALTTSISIAQELIDSSVEGEGNGHFPREERILFQSAINKVKAHVVERKLSQDGVFDAISSISKARLKFEQSEIAVDFSILKNSISEARANLISSPEGTGEGQYPVTAKSSFEAAILKSDAIYVEKKASQETVNLAVKSLEEATRNFKSSVIMVNIDILLVAIRIAQVKLDSSTIGFGNGEYPPVAKSILQSEINNARETIDRFKKDSPHIETVITQKVYNQSLIDDSVAQLAKATLKFEESIINVDYSQLIIAANEAKKILLNISEGNGHGQYPDASISAFKAVLNSVETIAIVKKASQSTVDATISTLNNAKLNFESSAHKVDFSNIEGSVNSAQSRLEKCLEDFGDDLTDKIKTDYELAIHSAHIILSKKTASTQQVKSSLSELANASEKFESHINDIIRKREEKSMSEAKLLEKEIKKAETSDEIKQNIENDSEMDLSGLDDIEDDKDEIKVDVTEKKDDHHSIDAELFGLNESDFSEDDSDYIDEKEYIHSDEMSIDASNEPIEDDIDSSQLIPLDLDDDTDSDSRASEETQQVSVKDNIEELEDIVIINSPSFDTGVDDEEEFDIEVSGKDENQYVYGDSGDVDLVIDEYDYSNDDDLIISLDNDSIQIIDNNHI